MVIIMGVLAGCLYIKPNTEKIARNTEGDRYFLEGVKKYNDGDYTGAVIDLEEAVSFGTILYGMDKAYSILGNTYCELELYDKAVENGEKAVELAPDSCECLTNLGVAYRQNGELDKAMETYKKALEIEPDYANLNSSIGTLYIVMDQPQEAIICFKKAIESDASLAVTYGNLALAYALAGDFENADAQMENAIRHGYENADMIKEKIDTLRQSEIE